MKCWASLDGKHKWEPIIIVAAGTEWPHFRCPFCGNTCWETWKGTSSVDGQDLRKPTIAS